MMKISRNLKILLATYIIYGILWSYITIMRYRAFNAGVFDLGVASALLYSVFHQPFELYYNGQPMIAMNKMIYLLIAPFFNLYPDPEVLLVFLSFFIPISMFPIYGISKQVLGDENTSLFIALTYIFYYPLGGVNWFDFHYMALVPSLFLAGFYFFLKKNYKLSILFFILTDISNFLAPLIMIIFSIIIFITAVNSKEKKFSIFLLIFSIILFSTIVVYFGISYLFYWTNYHSIPYYILILQTSIFEKLLYIAYMFGPLLFIPFLDRKYIYLIIPYIGFAFLNNYFPYIDPMFFQYPSLVTPFIFISLIFGMRELAKKPLIKKETLRKIGTGVLSVNIALALVLMPWGPFNSQVICSYDLKNNIKITQEDVELSEIISMIPKGSSVLIQDNMPQLAVGYNWILPDYLKNGVYPEYIITDPYSNFFYNYSVYYPQENRSMMDAFNQLYSTGFYGIYAEYKGIILLKLNYTGNPVIFEPIKINVTGNGKIQFLPPGKYELYSPSNSTLLLYSSGKRVYYGPPNGSFTIGIYYSGLIVEGVDYITIVQKSP